MTGILLRWAAMLAGVCALAACASLTAPSPQGLRGDGTPSDAALAAVSTADETAELTPKDPIDALTLRLAKARETGRWRDGELVIDDVPAALIPDYANWFVPRARDFPPLWIYASARKLAQGGDYVKAVYWYIVARERHLRQLRHCRDVTAQQQIIWADAAFTDLRQVMAKNPDLTRYAEKHAFAWLDLNPDTDAGLLDACLSGVKGQDRYTGATLVPETRHGKKIFVLTPPPVKDAAKWLIPAKDIYEPRIWSRILMKRDIAKILGENLDQEPPLHELTPLR